MDAKRVPALTLLLMTTLCTAGVAQAQLSSTWTLASDYDFRGTSNSATDPVFQGSIDYEASNGFLVGAWASNIEYGPEYDGGLELDYNVGYAREISEGRTWSAGVTYYTYPDSSDPIQIQPYIDGYVDVTLGGFHAAQWYTPDYAGAGARASYSEADYTWTLPRELSLTVHAGYSYGEYFEEEDLGGGTLGDFALTLSRALGHFTLAGKITGTDASGERRVQSGPFANDTRFVLSIATTFPWED